MTIESMMDDEPRATVLRQKVVGSTDGRGLPKHELVGVIEGVRGRLVKLNNRQVSAWMALAVEAEYEFITLEEHIDNGMFLSIDGRLFRVTGTRGKRMAKGSIPSYWKYPLTESSRT